jgi:hypothetical protein
VAIEEPPATRLIQRPGSAAALMPSEWRDPDDVTPGARRTPRAIAGWRTYDPLRKMMGHAASGISTAHVLAADLLREQVDLALLGFSAARPLIYVAQTPLPRWGLGPAALAQMRAVRSLRRVVGLFSPPQLLMLEVIVLRNITLRQWVLTRDPPSPAREEKRRLLIVLDRLAAHYEGEIESDLASGRRLPP